MKRVETYSSIHTLLAEQQEHSIAAYASYMVKALNLLFDKESDEEVRLDQPLETLAKINKASHAIESSDEPVSPNIN